MSNLGDILDFLGIGSIASSTENDADFSSWIYISRCHQCTSGIVDAGRDLDRHILARSVSRVPDGQLFAHILLERRSQHIDDIVVLDVGCAEAFGPSNEIGMIDSVLAGGRPSQPE